MGWGHSWGVGSHQLPLVTKLKSSLFTPQMASIIINDFCQHHDNDMIGGSGDIEDDRDDGCSNATPG